jgi:hypothetical protein
MKLRHSVLLTVTLTVSALTMGILAASAQEYPIDIPFRGNAYVTQTPGGDLYRRASRIISPQGELLKWDNDSTVISLYFKAGAVGDISLAVKAAGQSAKEKAKIRFSALGKHKTITVKGAEERLYKLGKFRVAEPGYIKVDIQGVRKTTQSYPRIVSLAAAGSAVADSNNYVTWPTLKDSYWYRRGPSVHFGYTMPSNRNCEYFYNEVVVPEGADVPGTYFMLTGFSEGYMGIQSNTDGEGRPIRNVLFSVWSPYNTDNPQDIPEEDRVQTLRRGENVRVRDFGNEGSGGQSYMVYPWETGKVYKTLVRVTPDGKGNTVYTGYFCDEKGVWHLMASFLRPKTDTWYKGAHSFLECFAPETSIESREVHFPAQWVRTADGEWVELTEATFTTDATGLSGVRTDKYGAVEDNAFVLRNCGFFNESTIYRTKFHRQATGKAPYIDLEALEKL